MNDWNWQSGAAAIHDAAFFTNEPSHLADDLDQCPLTSLTRDERKLREYPVDTAFREAWADLSTTFGADATKALQRLAIIILKPDAIVARRAAAAMEFIETRGFTPLAVEPLRFTAESTREEWRFQWNQLTLDRIHLSTKVMTAGTSLLVVLRDDAAQGVPATVRLQKLKGPSLPSLHARHHLRWVLRANNRVFKFVHAADEPADIVRTLGVVLRSPARCALLGRIAGARSEEARGELSRWLNRLHAEVASHDLDFDAAWGRVSQELEAACGRDSSAAPFVAELRRAVDACRSGRRLRWRIVEKQLQRIGAHIELWDAIVVGAQLIHQSYEGDEALIGHGGIDGWYAQ
jgi:nucleoside diphosphate kinase